MERQCFDGSDRKQGKSSRRNRIVRILILAAIFAAAGLMLTGCVPGDGACTPENKAGFFSGIWHGWIAPFSLIYSIFKKNISIYEVQNIGWWYDFGYYIAVISGFGGIAFSRRKRREKEVKHVDGI